MIEMINTLRNLVKKPEGRHHMRQLDGERMIILKWILIRHEGNEWIQLEQERDQW
jgi:hypothetical protein